MKILVATAFLAILGSLASALFFMMRGGTQDPAAATQDPASPAKPTGNMVKALAIRVGISIVLFLCILLAWKLGYIQPSGIPAGA
jgi:hypothetical protein